MIKVHPALASDIDTLMPRVRALNDHEGITVATEHLRDALEHLLANPELGTAFLVLRDDAPIGYALTTFSYDLEYGGREAWMTEFWIDEVGRSGGVGQAAIELIGEELRIRNIFTLHLQVRPENRALRLYERMGFKASPRIVMTKRLK